MRGHPVLGALALALGAAACGRTVVVRSAFEAHRLVLDDRAARTCFAACSSARADGAVAHAACLDECPATTVRAGTCDTTERPPDVECVTVERRVPVELHRDWRPTAAALGFFCGALLGAAAGATLAPP